MSVYEWECVGVCDYMFVCFGGHVWALKCGEARASEADRAVAETRRAHISVCPPVMMCR